MIKQLPEKSDNTGWHGPVLDTLIGNASEDLPIHMTTRG